MSQRLHHRFETKRERGRQRHKDLKERLAQLTDQLHDTHIEDHVTPSRPTPSLATLPAEVSHQICRVLDQAGTRTDLASLRLSCKSMSVITEEYLFSKFFLNTTPMSCNHLLAIGRSRFAKYIKYLHFDAEPTHQSQTFVEYMLNVNAFGKWETPQEDLLWGRQYYETPLYEEAYNKTPQEIQRYYSHHEEVADGVRRLGRRLGQLMCTLTDHGATSVFLNEFTAFVNLEVLEVVASDASVYRVPPPRNPFRNTGGHVNHPNSKDFRVRRMFLDTLSLPPVARLRGSQDAKRVRDAFLSTVVRAAGCSPGRLRSVRILGISRLVTPFYVPKLSLKELVVKFHDVDAWYGCRKLTDDLIRFLSLTEFESIDISPFMKVRDAGAQHDRDMFHWVPLLQSNTGNLQRLRSLALDRVKSPVVGPLSLFADTCLCLRKLSLSNSVLMEGCWVDVFHQIRRRALHLEEFNIAGPLTEKAYRLVWMTCPRPSVTDSTCATPTEPSLLQQLEAWMIRNTEIAPLRASLQGGSESSWIEASDDTMTYVPMAKPASFGCSIM